MRPILYGGSPDQCVELSKVELPYPVEIWIDSFKGFPGRETCKLFVVTEPHVISGLRQKILDHAHHFRYVLTFDDILLKKLPHAVLLEYGTSWMTMYGFPEKMFGVSFVCGFKNAAPGHKLRHDIWRSQNRIRIPKTFYISGNKGGLLWQVVSFLRKRQGHPILGAHKDPLFSTQFHIAIENVKAPYYFSEKLLDCFMTKTVPIYWGCTNIETYFNGEGFISVANLQNMVEALNNLTPEEYMKRLPAIEDNYHLAKQYLSYGSRLADTVVHLCS